MSELVRDHPESAIDWPEIPAAAWSRAIGLSAELRGTPRSSPMIDDGEWAGVPIGGMGGGAIGRTHRGDYARWHLDPGHHRFESVPADVCAIAVRTPGGTVGRVLSPLRPEVLRRWSWDMPVGAGTYHALFPRAWLAYDLPDLPVRIIEEQLSPLIPGDYRSSSLPVGAFRWTIENTSAETIRVGLMASWQNPFGTIVGAAAAGKGRQGRIASNEGARSDALTTVRFRGLPGTPERIGVAEAGATMAIAIRSGAGVETSFRSRFAVGSGDDGDDVWDDFLADCALDDRDDHRPADPEERIAGAVAATLELAAGERRQVDIAVAWDLPFAEFGPHRLPKRYTCWYGTSGESAVELAAEALGSLDAWRTAIEDWQAPVLSDPARPEWYKRALFNELYYLVDGGTLWIDEPGDPTGVGRFALLECLDYAYYNTLDVNFYASFALLRLFPRLELSVIRDFAAAADVDDPEIVTIVSSGGHAPRKTRGALPHDLGGPDEEPFARLNRYRWQDPNIWKDLNPKFVLQLWRDHVATGDESLVRDAWPAVVQALEFIGRFDRDADGLPEHDGVPDQTYDEWPMSGPSAYGGSLWIGALAAGVAMARVVGDHSAERRLGAILEAARSTFERRLWTGTHYAYDLGEGADGRDTVMADQLVGQWYADATGLGDLLAPERVDLTLRTIHRLNVLGFRGGTMGPVNGVHTDGRIVGNHHAEEVWVGTAYALAAFMIGRGLTDEGWQTARGVADVTYGRGLWFRTPEAYDADGNFRATMYLRPLAIWAIEEALERTAVRGGSGMGPMA